jgi:hypothetical protein
MKAYDLAMIMIFINAGIYVTAAMNLFGDLSDVTGIFSNLSIFYSPLIKLPIAIPFIGGLEVKGIDIIALALAGGTVVVFNTNAINSQGVAYITFTTMFWGSFLLTSVVINKIDFPGVTMFYSIFLLASVLIFTISLVQMPTGGQKSFE